MDHAHLVKEFLYSFTLQTQKCLVKLGKFYLTSQSHIFYSGNHNLIEKQDMLQKEHEKFEKE